MSIRARLLVLLLAAALAAGCTDTAPAAPVGGESPSPTESPEPSETPSTGDPIEVDLSPGGGAVTLDNGWSVQHCEGDAPFLCVHGVDGTTLGAVEFGSYPATDELTDAIADGTVVTTLESMVAEQHESIAADRVVGCGEGYDYRPMPATRVSVAGAPAVVYAFTGVVEGREIERHRAYFTVHDGALWIVTAAASDPEGCMASDLGEFGPADLASFEPYLDRIVAGVVLP